MQGKGARGWEIGEERMVKGRVGGEEGMAEVEQV